MLPFYIIYTGEKESVSLHQNIIRESPPQFESQIMARVYIRSITRILCAKKLHFVSRNWRMENSFYSIWVQLYLIDYFDYLKNLISRINEVYVFFFNKISL